MQECQVITALPNPRSSVLPFSDVGFLECCKSPAASSTSQSRAHVLLLKVAASAVTDLSALFQASRGAAAAPWGWSEQASASQRDRSYAGQTAHLILPQVPPGGDATAYTACGREGVGLTVTTAENPNLITIIKYTIYTQKLFNF